MLISKFSRIDTVTFPGKYHSVIELSEECENGQNMAEIANTVRLDRNSLDGVIFVGGDVDILRIKDVHKAIREIRPAGLEIVISTSGVDPVILDDLIGAGYAGHVLFSFDQLPDADQRRSVEVTRRSDAKFSVRITLDPEKMSPDALTDTAEVVRGADSITLIRHESATKGKSYKKNELTSMAKSLKGFAKEVRVL